ncbi:hypothetical protein BD309DRAFT_619094 [Dichomitus squalens]|nr:hypothetical protein BD309DRAFT_619094 [Dichomitus squalens]
MMNPPQSLTPVARCKDCNEKFPTKKAARRHAASVGHTGGVGFWCGQCDEILKTLASYNEHVWGANHARQRLACAQCQAYFASASELLRHHRILHPLITPLLNKCAQCGQEYPIGGSHTQCLDASIPCPTCNLRFASRRELAQHKHPKCKECKIGFEDAAGLSQHETSCPAMLSAQSLESGGNSLQSEVKSESPYDSTSSDSNTPSWHCRSCRSETCIDPVTTICGHLFCQECLIRELRDKMRCPVCNHIFFVRLNI